MIVLTISLSPSGLIQHMLYVGPVFSHSHLPHKSCSSSRAHPKRSVQAVPPRPAPGPSQLPAPRSGGASRGGGAVPPREAQGQRWREAVQWGLGLGGPPKKGARYANDLHVHSGISIARGYGFRGSVPKLSSGNKTATCLVTRDKTDCRNGRAQPSIPGIQTRRRWG